MYEYGRITEYSRFSNAYDNVTTLHPAGVWMLVVALIALFVLRRDKLFLPMILLTCLVPASQRIVIFDFDLHFLRILTLMGWVRIWVRGEVRPLRWTRLDKFVVAWAASASIVFFLRKASFGALVNSLGQAFDALGLYFLARMIIRDWRDLEGLVRSFAYASIPMAVLAFHEVTTGKNPFSFFDAVSEDAIVRDGRVRLRGAYAHQILAGCYWVVPAILCAGAVLQKRAGTVVPGIGLVCSLFIVFASSSSTPLMGLGLAIGAAALWPLRTNMRAVRWGLVAAMIGLQLIMSKPLWHLYHRITVFGVGGSTGYHRYRLIDAFVNRFGEWAALGLNSTASWGRQLEDVTNHFIGQGIRGGLLSFLLFVGIFAYAFAQNGMIMQEWRRNWRRAAFAWSLGIALFAQTMMMTATSYFGQILLVLWVSLGAIGGLTPRSRPRRSKLWKRVPRRRPKGSVGAVPEVSGATLARSTSTAPGAGEPILGLPRR